MANFLFNYSCIVLNGRSFKLIFLCSLGSTIHTCCGWKARHQRHILRCVNCINFLLKQKGQPRSQGHFSPTPKGGVPVNSVSPAPNKLERQGKRDPGNEQLIEYPPSLAQQIRSLSHLVLNMITQDQFTCA